MQSASSTATQIAALSAVQSLYRDSAMAQMQRDLDLMRLALERSRMGSEDLRGRAHAAAITNEAAKKRVVDHYMNNVDLFLNPTELELPLVDQLTLVAGELHVVTQQAAYAAVKRSASYM